MSLRASIHRSRNAGRSATDVDGILRVRVADRWCRRPYAPSRRSARSRDRNANRGVGTLDVNLHAPPFAGITRIRCLRSARASFLVERALSAGWAEFAVERRSHARAMEPAKAPIGWSRLKELAAAGSNDGPSMATDSSRSGSSRDPRMARRHARRPGGRRPRSRSGAHRVARRRGAERGRPRIARIRDALREHDSARAPGADARRPRTRGAAAPLHSMERARDGRAREQDQLGAGRPRRELRVGRHALRRGLQPLLPRAERHVRRRPRLLPGPLLARHLRARLPRRPHQRRAARALPPGGRAPRPLVVSASVADARLLAVSHRVDGSRADHVDLPGPLHALPARPRPRRHGGTQGVGLSGRRRDRRARIARRDLACRAREARQPHLRRSTATCSGSTVRCAATARSSRSSRACSRAPAGTSSR